MGGYNHYHDMDHDGDRDLKDAGMFHSMIDEEESSSNDSPKYNSFEEYEAELYRQYYKSLPREEMERKIAQKREEREIGEFVKGVFLVIFGGFVLLLFNGVFEINGFTAMLGLFCIAAFIRVLFIDV